MPIWQIHPVAVLDWQAGGLVHARAGLRAAYLPLANRFPALKNLTAREIVNALSRELGIRHFYVADLDALQGRTASGVADLIRTLWDVGGSVWLDQGPRLGSGDPSGPAPTQDLDRFRPVWGTESFPSPGAMLAYVAAHPQRNRGIISLDLQSGPEQLFWYGHAVPAADGSPPQPLPHAPTGDTWTATWAATCPAGLVAAAAQIGVRHFVILNLSDVGGAHLTTGPLLSSLRQTFPHIDLIAGGGIRASATLGQLAHYGVSHALVGTWLWEQLSAALQAPRGYTS
jgi:uncharacterized protein related to proFAR isomerase